MDNPRDLKNDAKQHAWDLFSMTGGIGYYLLYKELSGEHDRHDY